jgi:glycerophosphoryl diester phosphodiesterase
MTFTATADTFIRFILRNKDGTAIDTSFASNLTVYRLSTTVSANDLRGVLGYEGSSYIGKNILRTSPESFSGNGLTFTPQEDGSVIVDGTATTRTVYQLGDGVYRSLSAYGMVPDCEYILTGAPAGGRPSGYTGKTEYLWALIFQNTGSPNIADYGSGVRFRINGLNSTYRPAIDIRSGTVCDNLRFYPMLCPKIFYDVNSSYETHLPNNRELETAILRPQTPILDSQHLMIHRGGSWGAPQNTMPAFALCYEKGHCILECDLQVTRDGVVVICHDNDIGTTARNPDGTPLPGPVNITASTYAELLAYDFGIAAGAQYAGTRIPTLKEFLLFCKRRSIVAYLDTDSTVGIGAGTAIASAIYHVVKAAGMRANVIFDCQTRAVAEKFAALDGDLNLLVQGAASTAHVDHIAGMQGTYRRLIANCGASSYAPSVWTRELVEYIHGKGLQAKATITGVTPAQARAVFAIGTDFIMCDDLTPGDVQP